MRECFALVRTECSNLDLTCSASQTRTMANTYSIYIRFDFGTDEEKAQQARHKLDGWRQAFRLDKRVQYKMDRPESAATEAAVKPAAAEKPASTEKPAAASKSKEKPAVKDAAKAGGKSSEPAAAKAKPEAAANGKVGLLVRLYFSSHEKLSEQRWLARIPAEEPFKSASPRVINHEHPEFEATDQQFESISG
jgi:cell division septation protein DedD